MQLFPSLFAGSSDPCCPTLRPETTASKMLSIVLLAGLSAAGDVRASPETTVYSNQAPVRATAKLRTYTGIRRTSPLDTLSVDVEAWANPDPVAHGGEGGVDRVVFSISENGGPPVEQVVTAPALRVPNDSDQNSPLPGVSSGMAAQFVYGITLDCGALAAGSVRVAASVISAAGTVTPLNETVTLYNDRDGVDRRPCTNVIYCSPSGNDANDGLTSGSPKKSWVKSIEAVANGVDCGGGRIVMMAGTHEWAGGAWSVADWHTSGDWWLTLDFQPGAKVTGAATYPELYLTCRGVNGSGICRVRFVGAEWVGAGGVGYVPAGVRAVFWADGGTAHSAHWTALKPWSVRFSEDNSELFNFDGPGAPQSKRLLTCFKKYGCVTGFHGWSDLRDFVVSDWLGVCLQAVGWEGGNSATNGLLERQRYTSEVAGYVGLTSEDLSITIDDVYMRIDAVASGVDFAAALAPLEGTTYWGCKVSGAVKEDNNGTFPVVATGINGSGFPYVLLDNPNVLEEDTVGVPLTLETARVSGGSRYLDLVHTDLLQWNTSSVETLHSSIAARDIAEAQSWFTSGNNLTRCVLVNCTDGGSDLRANFTLSSLTDCLFLNCTFAGHWDWTTSGETFKGTRVVDCVVRQTSDFPPGIASGCHFVTGASSGSLPSTGSWFDTDPTVAPWSLRPLTGNVGTATAAVPSPAEWKWSSLSPISRGCWKNTGSYNWSTFSGLDLGALSMAGAGTLSPLAGLYRDLGTVPLSGVGAASPSAGAYLSLAAPFAGTSSVAASVSVYLGMSALYSGLSSIAAGLTAITSIPLVASFSGTGEMIATVRIQISELVQKTPLMHQRIYNALKALALEGPYYACTVNSKTGQMTIDQNKPLVPQGVVVYPLNSVFQPTAHWRQTLASERSEWNWVVRIEFPSIQVAFEAWEESLIDRDITIPDVEGFKSTRTLLARLLTAEYNPPPEASPNRGTVAEFAFQINPISLRK